jgi:glutaredoxin
MGLLLAGCGTVTYVGVTVKGDVRRHAVEGPHERVIVRWLKTHRRCLMAVKLHRCSLTWMKIPGHACHRVEKALDQQGIEYERVKVPLSRPKREDVKRITNQDRVPVIEFEDGGAYREESKDMAATIAAGRLFEKASPGATSVPTEDAGA